jgi:hypothetical protein
MVEVAGKLPSEFRQIGNFLNAKSKLKNVPNLRGSQTTILLGLMTIIPEEVKLSGILENPQRLAVIGAIVNYQIALNDRLDFEGAKRTDISDLMQEARNREVSARTKLDTMLINLPEAESKQAKDGIDVAVGEIEFTEKWIREKRDIDRYRNLVNAALNVATISVLFSREKLPLQEQIGNNENTTIEDLADKYAWVMGDNPSNNVERAVMIMHNVVMAAQIVDDWHGRNIDELLNIPSYASGALKMADGDKKTAKAVLNRKRSEYKAKARALGLGTIATEGPIMLTSILSGAYSFLVKRARSSELLRKKLNYRFALRETGFMSGKLDKK